MLSFYVFQELCLKFRIYLASVSSHLIDLVVTTWLRSKMLWLIELNIFYKLLHIIRFVDSI
jgi:hypothetical protein